MVRRNKRAPTRLIEHRPEWRRLRHPFQPQEVFSTDKIEAMHEMALKLLEELGLKVLLNDARDVYAKGGARVNEDMVFIGRDMVTAAIASAPASIQLRASSKERDLVLENGALVFGPGAGCPNATDLINGRRPGSLRDFDNALRLCQSFDVIHKLGPCCEPQDVPVHLRHYDMMRSQLSLSDKFPFVYGRGPQQVAECFEMMCLALGLSDEEFLQSAWCSTVVNTNSPRQIDRPMGQALMDFARAGQLTIITPFCLSGAMAPVTVAGALILQHAEALGALVLTQLVRPGTPVCIGGFGSNVDMKSGAPAFGTPVHVQMSIGTGQLCRHVGLPWRGAAGAASNAPDMQAAGETHHSLWGNLMANAGMVFHSAGWLEGGLTFGFEKFINDVEALQTIADLCTAPDASEDAFGWSALEQVDPGGHFFATDQTMQRYETAFYKPLVADLNNFGTWELNGAVTADSRATGIWQQVLSEFTPPEGGADRRASLEAYIADHTAAGGAPIMD
ncbi:trimethylamine---corrinoid protein Co-methyltransferase [Shimia gijangensis]|uniref:Methyltransferase n=1 Tax=Shimia gijangensis TaxID=1470563 RepID=A0A1M6J2L2_9RHOB|nr:trimethylamine methyltransferase family protein [Shimia gijangensis]SHJ40974.1 trimethylamine---corrinoid protein Co-methyltransferase [Shimia gijangensis]